MSKNEQRIDNWCTRENFEPTLVLELTRVLLEHFRSGLKISDMFHPNLTEANLKKQKILGGSIVYWRWSLLLPIF